jgi:hypothetical protein
VRASGDSHSVWSDDEGLVHLWAAASEASDAYDLDCLENGTVVHHEFDLSDPDAFTPAVARAPKQGVVLQPLKDPENVSQDDVLAAGYPPRPQKGTGPYESWLKLVSSSPRNIDPPKVVDKSGLHFNPESPATGTIWSGLELQKASTRYVESYMAFTIPTFSSTGANSRAALWGGIDNSASALIQDGMYYLVTGGVGNYTAWYEYLPDGFITPMFTVGAGDQIIFYAWEGNSSCSFSVGGGYGCFYWYDVTRNTTFGTLAYKAPSTANFTGYCCEGIMENNNSPTTWLASWSGTAVASLECQDSAGSWHTATGDPDLNWTLKNGSTTLATAANGGGTYGDKVNYTFVHSH